MDDPTPVAVTVRHAVRVETIVDYGLTDIVAEGIEAGIRLGGRWPRAWPR